MTVLAKELSWTESAEIEKEWIRRLGTMVPNGYNLTAGGDGLSEWSPSENTIEKRRKARRGYHHSLETRERIANSMKGHHNTLGQHRSTEFRKKMSSIMKKRHAAGVYR
jgi:hypothetical protein